MFEAQGDLCGVEARSTLREARRGAHVVDVELEVPSVHYRQNEAEGVLGLKGVREADLDAKKRQ